MSSAGFSLFSPRMESDDDTISLTKPSRIVHSGDTCDGTRSTITASCSYPFSRTLPLRSDGGEEPSSHHQSFATEGGELYPVRVPDVVSFDDEESMNLVPFVSLDLNLEGRNNEETLSTLEGDPSEWHCSTTTAVEQQYIWWGMDSDVTTMLQQQHASFLGLLSPPEDVLSLSFEEDDEHEESNPPEQEQEESSQSPLTFSRKVNRCPVPLQIELDVNTEGDPSFSEKDDDDTLLLFDTVEPLIQGRLPLADDDTLQLAANELEGCLHQMVLLQDNEDVDEELVERACQILQQYPVVAQVRYSPSSSARAASSISAKATSSTTENVIATPPRITSAARRRQRLHEWSKSITRQHRPSSASTCYPLNFFCIAGSLKGLKASYQAFPEAIGRADGVMGTPLHYACSSSRVSGAVVQFLLEKFPEAARVTNHRYQTPLHLICAGTTTRDTARVVQLLLDQYPTAVQLADADGVTPRYAGPDETVQRLLASASPGVTSQLR